MAHDYYHILQARPDDNPEVIKANYRSLMQKMHPDLGGSQADAALINEAYAVLSNPAKRIQYDYLLQRARAIGKKPYPHFANKQSLREPPQGKEKTRCLFCKQINYVTKLSPKHDELHCDYCQSPLCFIDFDLEWAGQRAPRSLKQNLGILFKLNANDEKPLAGKVDNLSPTGMLFSSGHHVPMGNIIKIDNQELSAVASVMRCTIENGRFVTGVKFLALKIHNARGTFVSHRV